MWLNCITRTNTNTSLALHEYSFGDTISIITHIPKFVWRNHITHTQCFVWCINIVHTCYYFVTNESFPQRNPSPVNWPHAHVYFTCSMQLHPLSLIFLAWHIKPATPHNTERSHTWFFRTQLDRSNKEYPIPRKRHTHTQLYIYTSRSSVQNIHSSSPFTYK
jgi:hypothetical protein